MCVGPQLEYSHQPKHFSGLRKRLVMAKNNEIYVVNCVILTPPVQISLGMTSSQSMKWTK